MLSYISPSSFNLFYSDRAEFYVRYKGKVRDPQTPAMALGTVVDALVKDRLCQVLGRPGCFDKLFEEGVEPGVRDLVLPVGRAIYKMYAARGLLDLMVEIDMGSVRWEGDMLHTVDGTVPVPILGKPDLWWENAAGGVVLDWKVNGYYSKAHKSPTPGYVRHIDSAKPGIKTSGRVGLTAGGQLVDLDGGLWRSDWAVQLAFYSLMLGSRYVAIDQLLPSQGDNNTLGRLRVAAHRCAVDDDFVSGVMKKVVSMWTAVQTGFIFFDTMDREESNKEVERLDNLIDFYRENPDFKSLTARQW